jgi:hypothetical protein
VKWLIYLVAALVIAHAAYVLAGVGTPRAAVTG